MTSKVAVLTGGPSYGWWINKHNRHHAHPNEVDKDPDIAPGALVYTGWQAQRRSRAGRLWSRLQAYLFFPLLLLEGLNLHVSSVRALASRTTKSRRRKASEIILFSTAAATHEEDDLCVLHVRTIATASQRAAVTTAHDHPSTCDRCAIGCRRRQY